MNVSLCSFLGNYLFYSIIQAQNSAVLPSVKLKTKYSQPWPEESTALLSKF